MKASIFKYLIGLMALALLQSCSMVGPNSIPHDQFDYNTAIAESWREQTLLNIVKLRYADMPVFVEVASVVSGYTLESSISMGASVVPNSDLYNIGGSGKFVDRPTITYVPLTGDKFNRNMMTPIAPEKVMFLLMMGYSAKIVLPMSIDVINGLRSQRSGGANVRIGDDDYYRVMELMTEMQRTGSMTMSVNKKGGQEYTAVMLSKQRESEKVLNLQRELTSLLGLEAVDKEFKLVYGELPREKGELAIMTRSILQIMIELSTQIDVPKEHIENGLTISTVYDSKDNGVRPRLIDIKATKDKPEHAQTAIFYQGYWFWVDNQDFKSKATFAYLMMLFSLTESGPKAGLPVVTISSG